MGTTAVVENLRLKIREIVFETVDTQAASFGVATLKDDETGKSLIHRAKENEGTSTGSGLHS